MTALDSVSTHIDNTPHPYSEHHLRSELKNAETPIERKPAWVRTHGKITAGRSMRNFASAQGIHTVCEEAGCPNVSECWNDHEASFLIGGARCTRRCAFCQIDHGKPSPLDEAEPQHVAESVRQLGLHYVTITGVTRDDLDDGAAHLWAETVRRTRELNPNCGIEILTDDFEGKTSSLDTVFDSRPEVFAHNIETVPRLMKKIRPAFRLERSLDLLNRAHEQGLITKSNLILGLGETNDEVVESLHQIHDAGVDIITITQYLRPTKYHMPVQRWVTPKEFIALKQEAEKIGFSGVLSGPLVRSSYRSGRLWVRAMRALNRDIPQNLKSIEEQADEDIMQEVIGSVDRAEVVGTH
ncbi:MAG: lipoyl synthase [Actinomycetaceae bacterium]|nr:lipoyl synthase [Actinomycetaceae bacterium]MDY6083317.1 lipoyl synthase [Actinomycetaceae bacterium]